VREILSGGILILALVFFLMSVQAGALEVFFSYGYYNPDLSRVNEELDADFNQPFGTNLRLEGGTFFGGGLETTFHYIIKARGTEFSKTSFKFRLDLFRFETTTQDNCAVWYSGYLKKDEFLIGIKLQPVFVSAICEKLPTYSGRFSYAFGAGVGMCTAHIKARDRWEWYLDGELTDSGELFLEERQNLTTYQVLGRISWRFDRSSYVFVEGRYIWGKTRTEEVNPGMEIDWSGPTGSVGLVYSL